MTDSRNGGFLLPPGFHTTMTSPTLTTNTAPKLSDTMVAHGGRSPHRAEVSQEPKAEVGNFKPSDLGRCGRH